MWGDPLNDKTVCSVFHVESFQPHIGLPLMVDGRAEAMVLPEIVDRQPASVFLPGLTISVSVEVNCRTGEELLDMSNNSFCTLRSCQTSETRLRLL